MKPRASIPATLSIRDAQPRRDQRFDGDRKGARVAQQRGDVAELDARLGVIRDGTDRLPEKSRWSSFTAAECRDLCKTVSRNTGKGTFDAIENSSRRC